MARKKKKGGYRTRIKKVYTSRGGRTAFKPYLDGGIAGAGGGILSKWLGDWGNAAAAAIAGYFFKNNTLKTLSGFMAGQKLGGMLGGGNAGGITGVIR